MWVALLGRRDMPTDGVEDYCTFLARALPARGIEMKQARVAWLEKGWIGALLHLLRERAAWRGRWVLMQYTAFIWSRRGFPFGAVAALWILRRGGVRVAIVFHDPWRQGGVRPIDRLRGACQDWVIRRLYRGAAKSIFTVPLETVTWLPKEESKATFIPLGANIPERVGRRASPTRADAGKTVIVFGVTGAPEMTREVEEIARVMQGASRTLGGLRLVAVGRGSAEAREPLVKSLDGCDVQVVVRGVIPAEEVAREFEQADALLFIRGVISPRRGSVMAGIACGLPIVGYSDGDLVDLLKEAGVERSPWGDRDGLVRGLVRVLSDPRRWMDLHERNLALQRHHLSWNRIAERFWAVLAK
jgi:glycosyltransferase involved in cell wall biosynthesis